MSEIIADSMVLDSNTEAAVKLPQDDVVQQKKACATVEAERRPTLSESDIPPKKRKTRRGKTKRRHPYMKDRIRKSGKVMKPKAPHNSNQFLLEDHGYLEELGENLKGNDQVSTSTLRTRTRDSSFSVDSDEEFYSSPDDEDDYLIKDFDDQYESLQVERLQSLSKDELIQDFLMMENRMESLSKRLQKRCDKDLEQVQEVESSVTEPSSTENTELQSEIHRLIMENDTLRRENELLRSKLSLNCNSDSEDSETDSSDSCSSSSSSRSSSCSGRSPAAIVEADGSVEVNYSEAIEANGHTTSSITSV